MFGAYFLWIGPAPPRAAAARQGKAPGEAEVPFAGPKAPRRRGCRLTGRGLERGFAREARGPANGGSAASGSFGGHIGHCGAPDLPGTGAYQPRWWTKAASLADLGSGRPAHLGRVRQPRGVRVCVSAGHHCADPPVALLTPLSMGGFCIRFGAEGYCRSRPAGPYRTDLQKSQKISPPKPPARG